MLFRSQISVKNSVYIVNRMGTRWSCNCTGYRYRKSCSHVLTAKTEYENATAKKYGQDQNTALLLEQAGVESNGKLKLKHKPKGRYIMVKSVNTKTQAGVALALYQKNKKIAEIVLELMFNFLMWP